MNQEQTAVTSDEWAWTKEKGNFSTAFWRVHHATGVKSSFNHAATAAINAMTFV